MHRKRTSAGRIIKIEEVRMKNEDPAKARTRRFFVLDAPLLICLILLAVWNSHLHAQAPVAKPKVRTVCAFVRIDRTNYKSQVGDAIKVLVAARDEFVKAGYEVQTVRITTQPFTDYTRGMNQAQALAFLREYIKYLGDESKRIGTSIAPNIGPAMVSDNDDPAAAELLTEALSTGLDANASIIMAGDDGIHWNAVRASARLIKQVSERSDKSQGTFNFAATAMLPPYAPFFPGSWHDGPGKKFSI